MRWSDRHDQNIQDNLFWGVVVAGAVVARRIVVRQLFVVGQSSLWSIYRRSNCRRTYYYIFGEQLSSEELSPHTEHLSLEHISQEHYPRSNNRWRYCRRSIYHRSNYRRSTYRRSNSRRSKFRRSNCRRSKFRRNICRGAFVAEQLSPSAEQMSSEQ